MIGQQTEASAGQGQLDKRISEVVQAVDAMNTQKAGTAIDVLNVSKSYRIYDRPQDRLKQAILSQLHSLTRGIGTPWGVPTYYRDFWALCDVSFSIARGEAVGIIGRNGAGKSTLLQIIAGTLASTTGTVAIDGKVGALLELGSGFNPEFTGSENVYFNAALLGLSRSETDTKFDQIASFADIGSFINEPVKTYSTGMLVRLAFAVHAAVRPEILIVDEALAVGDIFFQAKCMARLRRLLADGVTILFVSHDIGTVRQLCSRAILLDAGKVVDDGPVQVVTDHYQRLDYEDRNRRMGVLSEQPIGVSPVTSNSPKTTTTEPTGAPMCRDSTNLLADVDRFRTRASNQRGGNGGAEFINVQMLKNGRVTETFDYGDAVTLRQVARFSRTLEHVNVCYKIRTLQGLDVIFGDTRITGDLERRYVKGHLYVFEWTFHLHLMHGNYAVMSGLAHPPGDERDDWSFIDMVPTSLIFTMSPREAGMIDALVVWPNTLLIEMVGDSSNDAMD